MAIGLSMQAKVLSLAPDATDVAMAIFSGLYNFGIGSGALLGNQVSLHLGMGNIGFVAAPLALIALGWCLLSFYRSERLQQHPAVKPPIRDAAAASQVAFSCYKTGCCSVLCLTFHSLLIKI